MKTTEPSKPQIDKFKDLARELEADEDEGRFEETVKKVATTPPPGPPAGAAEK